MVKRRWTSSRGGNDRRQPSISSPPSALPALDRMRGSFIASRHSFFVAGVLVGVGVGIAATRLSSDDTAKETLSDSLLLTTQQLDESFELLMQPILAGEPLSDSCQNLLHVFTVHDRRFIESNEAVPELRLAVALAAKRLGVAANVLQDGSDPIQPLRQAKAAFASLAKDYPRVASYVVDRIAVGAEIATLAWERGEAQVARSEFLESFNQVLQAGPTGTAERDRLMIAPLQSLVSVGVQLGALQETRTLGLQLLRCTESSARVDGRDVDSDPEVAEARALLRMLDQQAGETRGE